MSMASISAAIRSSKKEGWKRATIPKPDPAFHQGCRTHTGYQLERRVGRSGGNSIPGFDLQPPQPAKTRRQIYFQALGARTPEAGIVGEDDVSAALANHAPVGEDFHRPKASAGNAIWTAV